MSCSTNETAPENLPEQPREIPRYVPQHGPGYFAFEAMERRGWQSDVNRIAATALEQKRDALVQKLGIMVWHPDQRDKFEADVDMYNQSISAYKAAPDPFSEN